MNTVFIMRGIPGSGKSAAIEYLTPATVVSADNYFTNFQGEYNFDRTKLGAAHNQCREKFLTALEGRCSPIVVDNTNIKREEWEWYKGRAKQFGYQVITCTIESWDAEKCHKRNSHGVPLDVIERMGREFER